jgi:O-antigen/teichoic acid export membrane protein
MISEKKVIAKDTFFYTISQFIAQGIGIATSILIRNFLGPALMGVWSAIKVLLDYTQYCDIGLASAVCCEIPYLRGAGKNDSVEKVKDLAFTFNLIVSLLLIIFFVAGSFFLRGAYERYAVYGIRIAAIIASLTLFTNLLLTILRAEKKFLLISKVIILQAVIMLVFALTLVSKLKLYGMYLSIPAVIALTAVFIISSEKMRFRLFFEKKLFIKLLAVGLPLFFYGIVYTMYMSVDKIMIIKMIGPEALGYYSLVILVMGIVESFPRLFSIVLFPRTQERYGETQSYDYIRKYVEKPTKLVFYLGILVFGYAYFMISGLVPIVMPKFTYGIISAKIIMCGLILYVLTIFSENFIVSTRKQIYEIPMVLTCISIMTALNFYFIKNGFGIAGVAMGTSISYAIFFFMVSMFAFKHFLNKKEILRFYLDILLPYVYLVLAIIFIERLFAGKEGITVMFSEFFIYAIFSIPLFILAYEKKIFNEISGLIKFMGKK